MTLNKEEREKLNTRLERELRDLYQKRLKPASSLKTMLGDQYDKKVQKTRDPHKVKIGHETITLDKNGLVRAIDSYASHEEFEHDRDGYLTKASVIENAGQGFDRYFEYEKHEAGKRLSKLSIDRFDASYESSKAGLVRGKKFEHAEVNFDKDGNPDKLVPLWVYTGR